jgi:hypothetical protein
MTSGEFHPGSREVHVRRNLLVGSILPQRRAILHFDPCVRCSLELRPQAVALSADAHICNKMTFWRPAVQNLEWPPQSPLDGARCLLPRSVGGFTIESVLRSACFRASLWRQELGTKVPKTYSKSIRSRVRHKRQRLTSSRFIESELTVSLIETRSVSGRVTSDRVLAILCRKRLHRSSSETPPSNESSSSLTQIYEKTSYLVNGHRG